MKSSFVKVLAVLVLVISIIAGLILISTVLGVTVGISILGEGIVLSFVLFALSGILKNQEDNNSYLNRMCDYLEKLSNEAEKMNKDDDPNIVKSSNTVTYEPYTVSSKKTWFCPHCGTENDYENEVCKNCDFEK